MESSIFSDRAPGALLLHLPKIVLILCAIERHRAIEVVFADFEVS